MQKTPIVVTSSQLGSNNNEPKNENQLDLTSSDNSFQGKGDLVSAINVQITKSDLEGKRSINSYRKIIKKRNSNKLGNIYTFIRYQGNFLITIGPQCTLFIYCLY